MPRPSQACASTAPARHRASSNRCAPPRCALLRQLVCRPIGGLIDAVSTRKRAAAAPELRAARRSSKESDTGLSGTQPIALHLRGAPALRFTGNTWVHHPQLSASQSAFPSRPHYNLQETASCRAIPDRCHASYLQPADRKSSCRTPKYMFFNALRNSSEGRSKQAVPRSQASGAGAG